MSSITVARSANATFSPSYLPSALFVGATGGIGQGMAQSFAQHTKGNAKIIIVGRNKAAAEATIATFPKPTHPDAFHEFVPCDISLMQNVRSLSSEILTRLPKINFLVMSQGILTMSGRDETDEGLDKKMAGYYYSRFALTKHLMPALEKATEAGEDAKVLSVLAAGYRPGIDWDDLGLKKTFAASKVIGQCGAYTDVAFEELSKQNPDIAFIHTYPGGVRSNQFARAESSWMRIIGPPLMNLARPFTISQEDCAEYMNYALFRSPKGFNRIGSHGEDIGRQNFPQITPQLSQKLWDHTLEATGFSSQ